MRLDSDLNDDLSDLLNSPLNDRPLPVRAMPAATIAPDYSEPCGKCRGTGRFVGYTGRVLGPCFTCKGAGRFSFKTSGETRAKARAANAERKARSAAESVDAFKAANPKIWAWIESSPEFAFAVSMRDAIAKFGDLTPNQLAACQRCVDKRKLAAAERQARAENAPTVDIARVELALRTAQGNGIKRPRLLLDTFKFTLAPASGTNAGAIYVKEGDEYLGKIVAARFQSVRSCGDERQTRVLAAAADPEKAAVAYGFRTGSCSCCRRTLTNGESIERGIGPICASKFGW